MALLYLRCMLFADIPGHANLKAHLIQNARSGKISHAQLFLGPEGSGNLALALAYAQYLNCAAQNETDSCGVCPSCNKFNKLIHPDLHFTFPAIKKENAKAGEQALSANFLPQWRKTFTENPFLNYHDWMTAIGAENKQGNISMAECHDIISRLTLAPFEAGFKVLIMWLPEFLGKEGNALLKIIEEPPQKTLFLLVAHDYEQILPTITSRVLMVRIPRLQPQEIATELSKRFAVSSDEAIGLALLSEGNYNAAIKMAQDEVNVNEQFFQDWMRKCYSHKGLEISQWVDMIAGLGREKQKNFLAYAVHMLRECLMFRIGQEELVHLKPGERQFVEKFSPFIHPKNLPDLTRVLEEAAVYIERNANPKLVFMSLSFDVEKLLSKQLKGNA
jgi:DNA polymerase-3 subunit delta'